MEYEIEGIDHIKGNDNVWARLEGWFETVFGKCAAFKDDIDRTRLPMICSESEMNDWHRIGWISVVHWKIVRWKSLYGLVQDCVSRFQVGTSMSDAEGISRWLSKMFSILVDSVIKLKIAEKKKKRGISWMYNV